MNKSHGSEVIRTVCAHVDGGTCGLLMHVVNGVITRVDPADFPDRAHRGACAKGLATSQWVHHPDRLRAPLKRVGGRGEGKWQRISWEEALDDLSSKLKEIARRYGSTSVAWAVPDLPYLRSGGYSRLVSATKGTWVDCVGFGDLAGPCADFVTFGWPMGDIYSSLVKEPKLTIVWGFNPAETAFRSMRVIMEAKKRGSKLVVIDPRLSTTASRADEYIQIRPGTDGALALGMLHVILEKGLQDELFIVDNTVGSLLVSDDSGLFLRESDLIRGGGDQVFMVFDEDIGQPQRYDAPGIKPTLTGSYSIAGVEYRPAYQLLADMVREYTPEYVSNITDIPADVISRLAVEYATQKPAAIHRGLGMQRTFYGDLSCRALNTLAAITGNMNLRRPSRFVLNARSFNTPAGSYNRLPIMMLYDAIVKEDPLAIKAVFFAGRNYVSQLPNMNRITDEVLPRLELMVVCDLFMTATARYADYVLPAASFCESIDLVMGGSAFLPYLQLQQKVIEPLYECKSDFEIAAELGRRMGFGEYFNKREEHFIEEILDSGHPTMEGISLERLRQGPVQAESVERPPEFRTPTGKIEFYVERLSQFGQELPIYLEPVESARCDEARTYPLSLISPHPRYRLHSTLANVPHLLKIDPEPFVEINPEDAKSRNISDGDMVCVFNDRGQVKLRTKLARNIKPGVVAIAEGWWPEQYIEGHLNQLTHDRINPAQQSILGPNAALCDVLVDV